MSEVEGPVQRIRVVFSQGEPVKYIAHLAVMRAWERVMRRAAAPIAYSFGFNPRPKLTFASALAVGQTGRAEIMDVELNERLDPEDLLRRLRVQLPPGFAVHSAAEVPVRAPALQAEMRCAVYRVTFGPELSEEEVRAGLADLWAAEQLPRQREVKGHVREYDLRPLIRDAWYVGRVADEHVVGLTLVADNTAAGRPDEVLKQLGWVTAARSVERVRLVFRGDPDDSDTLRAAVDPVEERPHAD
jgi:radical SAM-linked protein